MELKAKFFDELSLRELYELLRARAEVFVLEQQCAYQDLDGRDFESLHVFFERDGKIVAYLRAFQKERGVVQMGRVLTLERKTGLGGKLLREGLKVISDKLSPSSVYIEAQCYATGFYEREGFKICSEAFLEDGIPHVGMMKAL